MSAAISVDRDPGSGSLGFVVVYSTAEFPSRLRLWGQPPALYGSAEVAARAVADALTRYEPAWYFLRVVELVPPVVVPPGLADLDSMLSAIADAGAALGVMERADATSPSAAFNAAVARVASSYAGYLRAVSS